MTYMTLKDLSQLYFLNREIEVDRKRIASLEAEIKRSEEYLADLVLRASSASGSCCDGMPKNPTYGNALENTVIRITELRNIIERKKDRLLDCEMTIQAKQTRCLAERSKLERYIADLPNGLLRLIFTLRFIDGLTWGQVSESIGVRTTEEGVKKMCYRYLAEQKKEG